MIPLLPFALGLFGGAAAVGLLRNKQARSGLASAGTRLREAAVSGLDAAERSSARLRERLAQEATQEAADEAPAATADAKPTRKRAPRKPAGPRATSRRKTASGDAQ